MPGRMGQTSHDGPARFVLRENGSELLLYQYHSAEYAMRKLDSALVTSRKLLGAEVYELYRTRYEGTYECWTSDRWWHLAVVREDRDG